jgi:hypothetical protein
MIYITGSWFSRSEYLLLAREHLKFPFFLAGHFLKVFAEKFHKPIPFMYSAFIAALKNHPWKVYIREL